MNDANDDTSPAPALTYSARSLERLRIERSDETLCIRLPPRKFRDELFVLAPRVAVSEAVLIIFMFLPNVIEGQWLSPIGWFWFVAAMSTYFIFTLILFAIFTKTLVIRATRDSIMFGREGEKRPRQWSRDSIVGIHGTWLWIRLRGHRWFSGVIALDSEAEHRHIAMLLREWFGLPE